MSPDTLAEALAGDDDIVIGHDLYGDADPLIDLGEHDPVSEAVGSAQFMAEFVLDECVQEFHSGQRLIDPERFDRFYWRPDTESYDGPAPVLVDILRQGSPEERDQEARAKHVEFKRGWCEEHGYRYVVLVEDECQTPEQVRAQLEGKPGTPANPISVTKGAERPRRSRAKRGQVQRPRTDSE